MIDTKQSLAQRYRRLANLARAEAQSFADYAFRWEMDSISRSYDRLAAPAEGIADRKEPATASIEAGKRRFVETPGPAARRASLGEGTDAAQDRSLPRRVQPTR